MFDSIKSSFKTISELLGWLKDATTASIIRFFNKRKTHYDDLLARASSFEKIAQASDNDGATVIDVSGGGKIRRRDDAGSHRETIRTKDGTLLPVDGFTMPNRQKLATDNKLVAELEGASKEVTAMLARISSLTDRASKKIAKELKDYQKELDAKLDNMLTILEDISDKHMPALLTELAGSLYNHINDTIPVDSYEELGYEVYVTSHDSIVGKKNSPIEFTYYLHVEGLDKNQFKNEEFILAITGVITEHKGKGRAASKFTMAVYLTSLLKFERPGNFDKGKQINGSNLSNMKREIQSQAHKLLSLHGLGPVFGKRNIGITQQALRHSPILDIDGVVDVSVDDGEVVIELASVKEDVIEKDIWPKVIVHLNNLVRRLKGASYTYTLESKGKTKLMRIVRVQG